MLGRRSRSTVSNVIVPDNDSDEDIDPLHEDKIKWSNLIFLPFHPVFKLIVLITVLIKTSIGPLTGVFLLEHCYEIIDSHFTISIIKYFYLYLGNVIYITDTFLHMVHRQVTDKAMKREYLPKSAFLILLDVLSVIPLFQMFASDVCAPVQLYPNFLAFNECLIIYRIYQYFDLGGSHSYCNLFIGFTILLLVCVNCAVCLFLLMTYDGFCEVCKESDIYYDWRQYFQGKMNHTDMIYTTYIYAGSTILAFVDHVLIDDIKPSAILEYAVFIFLLYAGYFTNIFIIFPKAFSESIMAFRRICSFRPEVTKLINETRQRNPSSTAYIDIENFYTLIWKKRSGITSSPEILTGLPRYLRLEIKQDLAWPIFYHSPTLRKTSTPFKRYLSDHINTDFKLPGEKFFSGPHSTTHMYYLKSGVVQLISVDDGLTPILSVTSGTLFGDISFLLSSTRKAKVQCLTYCEVLYITRFELVSAIHKFPADRELVIKSIQAKLKHARQLLENKKHVKGADRADDEGIDWIKRRWWEISDCITKYKKRLRSECELPAEETTYHCAKYIGQFVLCTNIQLHMESIFANVEFPWILLSHSAFGRVWHTIVVVTVLFVLFLFPPCITKASIPKWFHFVKYWTDFVYAADICVSLLTSVEDENIMSSFSEVLMARFKSFTFHLDILAALWLENIVVVIGKPKYYYTCQFNRLIKTYIFFYTPPEKRDWNMKYDYLYFILYKIIFGTFCFMFISSYLIYTMSKYMPELTPEFFFGHKYCYGTNRTLDCNPIDDYVFLVAVHFMFEVNFFENTPNTLADMYLASIHSYLSFILSILVRSIFVGYIYLRLRDQTGYQTVVSNLIKNYTYHKLRPDLLKELYNYLSCYWKYYHGKDMMSPTLSKNIPHDIYWKVHGEIAEKTILQSTAFINCDPGLVRELAYAAKYLKVPRDAVVSSYGTVCKKLMWIVQGYVKCEYFDDDGELNEKYFDREQHVVAMAAVLLGKPSIRTYKAYTECEILFIKVRDFFKILKRYPKEHLYFTTCINENRPIFDQLYSEIIEKHNDHQTKIKSELAVEPSPPSGAEHIVLIDQYDREGEWKSESSRFMFYWMTFRTIIVVVAIICSSLQGGSGAVIRWPLHLICMFCTLIAWLDIFLKFRVGYYDKRGILIMDTRKRIFNYLTRGFILDVIGILPYRIIFETVMTTNIPDEIDMLINTYAHFAHLYIMMAYFDYLADVPMKFSSIVKIIKWQVIMIIFMFGASQYLVYFCINFTFDDKENLVSMTRRNTCWVPKYMKVDEEVTVEQLHMIFVESISLIQSGLAITNLDKFEVNFAKYEVGAVMFFLGVVSWFVMAYSTTLLVLISRRDNLFQHGVFTLKRFLHAERVNKKLIDHVIRHFSYSWIRSEGISIHGVMSERIGAVFKQDLSFYFFGKTYEALDTVLHGGVAFQRLLSSSTQQNFYLPSTEIMREMDLVPFVYIVHRGEVVLSQNGVRIAVLSKGGIFGQLIGTKARAARISAVSHGYSDVLHLTTEKFNEILPPEVIELPQEVRKTIDSHPQAHEDFIATRKQPENPYNTIQYILRGRKTIQLPWMVKPVTIDNAWFSKWLILTWYIGPCVTTIIVLILNTLPLDLRKNVVWGLLVFDIIHLLLIISEYFNMECTVVNGMCINRRIGYRMFKNWKIYVNIISLIVPSWTVVRGLWIYQLARLLRLIVLLDFHEHFCKNFETKVMPVLMKLTFFILSIHAMTCGWIYIACREKVFPSVLQDLPHEYNKTVDYTEWTRPDQRQGGCARVTRGSNFSFLVPKDWKHDYIVALTYITNLYTDSSIDLVMALTIPQIYYKILMELTFFLLNMWIVSVAVSAVYTGYRELYLYDYDVMNLMLHLRHSGVSPALLESVKKYTIQLWQRQRGYWLPELALQAPICLREDMFSDLYMHHIDQPALFRNLPHYFKRQMVARVQRIVIFPDKCIVEAGDIFPCIYFIHEGEVEKWHNDTKNDRRLITVLTTNGYFGVIGAMFPNTPFQYSYYTRTVVDIVYLRRKDWLDLLRAYPEVKQVLYNEASKLKEDMLLKQKILST